MKIDLVYKVPGDWLGVGCCWQPVDPLDKVSKAFVAGNFHWPGPTIPGMRLTVDIPDTWDGCSPTEGLVPDPLANTRPGDWTGTSD